MWTNPNDSGGSVAPTGVRVVTRRVVVVPSRAEAAALRVPKRVRAALRIEIFVVDDGNQVSGPK
jgi:hypothetical protein